MAFTSRAIRQTGVFKTATPQEVGPGSYDFALSGTQEQIRGRAPFSTTAERKLTAGQSDYVTPGPGSYIEQSKPNQPAAASSNTFVNRVQRFGPSAVEKEAVPGPGSYNRDVNWIKDGSGQRTKQPGPAAESSVVWFRNPSAPSIPTHAQSFGYEQGGDGRLVRQAPPPGGFTGAPNDAAGPGDYENPVSALSSRTTSWSKSKVDRNFVKETKTPGPGHYAKPINTMGDVMMEEEEDPPQGLSSFTSKVSRGLSEGNKTKKKNLTPGPGAYNAPTMFGSQQVPENLQFFGSTSRRGFEIEPSQYAAPGNWRTPGPGSYEEKRVSFKKGGASGKLARAAASSAPFDTLQTRFRDSSTSAPGPGEYEDAEAKSMVTSLARKTRARNGVFGTTTNRFFGSQMHAEITATGRNPGPGQYDVAGDGTTGAGSKATGRRRRPKQSSVFTSGTRRFTSSAPSSSPAPGAYDVVPKWPGEQANRLALLERDVFISNAERFSTKQAATGVNPGPGTYEADVVKAVDPRHMGVRYSRPHSPFLLDNMGVRVVICMLFFHSYVVLLHRSRRWRVAEPLAQRSALLQRTRRGSL
eukprot:COSAG02_NODE_431_length_22447_cov_7.487202_2_plen_582_part_00